MSYEFTKADIEQSNNTLFKDNITFLRETDNLGGLYYDSYRVGGERGPGDQHYTRKFNGDDFNAGGGPRAKDRSQFAAYLKGLFTEANYDRLINMYTQSLTTNIPQVLSYALFPQSEALPFNSLPTCPIRVYLDVNIFEEEGTQTLYADIEYSNFRVETVVGAEPEWTALPGNVSARYEFHEREASLLSCKVSNQLLADLIQAGAQKAKITKDKIEIETLIANQEIEDEAVKKRIMDVVYRRDTKSALAKVDQHIENTITDIEKFCNTIPVENVDDKAAGKAMCDFLHHQRRCAMLSLANVPSNPMTSAARVKAIQPAFKAMQDRIETDSEVFLRYPRWRETASNVLAALTVLGGLVMLCKGIQSKKKYGRFDPRLFRAEPESIEKMSQICTSTLAASAA